MDITFITITVEISDSLTHEPTGKASYTVGGAIDLDSLAKEDAPYSAPVTTLIRNAIKQHQS